MTTARSYAISDLEKLSGFDRRTIVYYIQSGLLPRAGRRGPNTRYPEDCLRRLRFIRGVRDLQLAGALLTVTLADIRSALIAAGPQLIGALLERGLPAAEVATLFDQAAVAAAEPQAPLSPPTPLSSAPATVPASVQVPAITGPAGERRSYGLADAGIRQRFGAAPAAEEHHDAADTHPRLPMLDPAVFAQDSPAPALAAAPAEPMAEDADLGELLRRLELQLTTGRKRIAPGASEQWTEMPITSRVYLSIRGLEEPDVPIAEALARILKRALRGR